MIAKDVRVALTVVGICALIAAAVLILFELWFEDKEPNIYGRVFESGLLVLGIFVGYRLVERECLGGG